MGHLPLTSVIREVNCLIVKDILLQIQGVNFSVIHTKPNKAKQKVIFELNCCNSVQQEDFFSPSNSSILLHKGVCCSQRYFRVIIACFGKASVRTIDIQINVPQSKSQAVGPLLPLCSHKPFIPVLPIDYADQDLEMNH